MSMVIQAADDTDAQSMRHADAARLESALSEGRARLLAMFDGFERALGACGLRIAFDPVLNLPLWELGHIGWFEEWWIARNRDRARGTGYAEHALRPRSLMMDADAFYDSSRVPHARRWQLALPDAAATRAYLAEVRDLTLSLLRASGPGDEAFYFFRLVLFHEDMHREAWFMIAQQLGIELGVAVPGRETRSAGAAGEWRVPAGVRRIGTSGPGFAFDNELGAHERCIDAFSIDRAAVSWARYLPFIEAGGYERKNLWTRDGWHWRERHGNGLPLHLRRDDDDGWQQRRFGIWKPLDPGAPAVQLSAHEADAWCRFAGRRLPTEAEWESAALLAFEQGEAFDWGRVWEWTASPFAPYPGFEPHPYRDYSQPFFDGRPVLRGASFATAPGMRHPRYRNYFPRERNDVFAGFRSCAAR